MYSGIVIIAVHLPSVRLLAVMGLPGAIGHFHIRKDGFEAGILRAAGVDAEADPACAFPHVTDPHLGEDHTVRGAFDAVIVFLPTYGRHASG